MADRRFDVVLHGASGFVGRLTAGHLAAHAGDARIALSGRSEERLRDLRESLGVSWPVIVADADDPVALAELAGSTTALATTVGPYIKHGLPLARACAAAGTAYADLTGEVLFARQSADELHEQARATGARIVHAVGFDAVPSDLGVLLLREQVTADGAGDLEDTVLVLTSVRGGISGGTIDSLRLQVAAVAGDQALREIVADPYALSPDPGRESDEGRVPDSVLPGRDPLLGRWVAPFAMATFNTRIVRRSNALQDFGYGPGFRYREVLGVGTSPFAPALAAAVSAGLVGLVAGMSLPPTRALLDRVLPKPGSGPSERTQEAGHFTVEVHTRTSTGARYRATVSADRDPGYSATAVMLGEGVLSLALDPPVSGGGVLTPAVAMGDNLVRRLRACGFVLSVARLTKSGR